MIKVNVSMKDGLEVDEYYIDVLNNIIDTVRSNSIYALPTYEEFLEAIHNTYEFEDDILNLYYILSTLNKGYTVTFEKE